MTTKAFVLEREIRVRAPRDRIFTLLSSRETFSLWMPVAILEPYIGGNVEFRFVRDDGSRITALGTITTYEPPSRIAFSWDFKDDPLDARTEVTIDLIAERETTLVRLTHVGFVDEEEAAKHADGWEYWLARFKAGAEGRDPGDDRSIAALHQSIES